MGAGPFCKFRFGCPPMAPNQIPLPPHGQRFCGPIWLLHGSGGPRGPAMASTPGMICSISCSIGPRSTQLPFWIRFQIVLISVPTLRSLLPRLKANDKTKCVYLSTSRSRALVAGQASAPKAPNICHPSSKPRGKNTRTQRRHTVKYPVREGARGRRTQFTQSFKSGWFWAQPSPP